MFAWVGVTSIGSARSALEQALALHRDAARAALDRLRAVAQRLEHAGLRELADAERRAELVDQRLGARAADRVAAAQPGQAPGLREAAEHDESRVVLAELERGVALLGVDEVAQRLVEQHDDALGQRVEQPADLGGGQQLTGRVVGVAERRAAACAR